MRESGFRSAAVCRRGHIQTGNVESNPYGNKCATCGAKVLTQCESCGHRIRGFRIGAAISYELPDFCDRCGGAHPWVGRQGRVFELQNRLEGEDLDPADELVVREQLDALVAADLDEDEQRKRWARVKKMAPQLWESSQPLITTLVSAAVQGKL